MLPHPQRGIHRQFSTTNGTRPSVSIMFCPLVQVSVPAYYLSFFTPFRSASDTVGITHPSVVGRGP
jgi:hypothetical protein